MIYGFANVRILTRLDSLENPPKRALHADFDLHPDLRRLLPHPVLLELILLRQQGLYLSRHRGSPGPGNDRAVRGLLPLHFLHADERNLRPGDRNMHHQSSQEEGYQYHVPIGQGTGPSPQRIRRGGYYTWPFPVDPLFKDHNRVVGFSSPQRLAREQSLMERRRPGVPAMDIMLVPTVELPNCVNDFLPV